MKTTQMPLHNNVYWGPVRVVVVYIVISLSWIFGSDYFLRVLFHDPDIITTLAMFKGFIFVVITAWFLYYLIRNEILKVAQSQQSYREVFNAANDAIFIHDADTGNIVDVNQSMQRVFGYTREEALRLTMNDISLGACPFSGIDARQWMAKAVADGPQVFEWHCRKSDGELFWAEVELKRADIGGKSCILAVVRDITSRRKAAEALRQSEEKFRTLFNNSEVGMFRSFMDGSLFLDANDKYLSMLGVRRDEVVGKPSLVVWVDAAERATMVEMLKANGFVNNYEFRARHKTGAERVFLTSLKLYPETGILEGSITDITERKKVEGALREAKEGAEAANKAKTEFLLNISHDIRTPLNAIMGLSGILATAALDEKRQKCVQLIRQQGFALLALVEDILHISKLESGQMTLRRDTFDLSETMMRSLDAARIGLGAKDVVVSCSMPEKIPLLKGDVLRVGQILNNILGNAVKYTDKGAILVSVTGANGGGSLDKYHVKFAIKDTGYGIAPEDMPRIFDPFTRFHEFHGGKAYEGVGLGLHITKTLVQRMGGEISVTSEVGKGSEFNLSLDFELD